MAQAHLKCRLNNRVDPRVSRVSTVHFTTFACLLYPFGTVSFATFVASTVCFATFVARSVIHGSLSVDLDTRQSVPFLSLVSVSVCVFLLVISLILP